MPEMEHENATAEPSTGGGSPGLGGSLLDRLRGMLRGRSFEEGEEALRPERGPLVPELPLQVGGAITRYGLVRAILEVDRCWVPWIINDAEKVGNIAVGRGILQSATRLGDPANRAEAAVMLQRAFGLPTLAASAVRRVFKDLSPFHWSAPAVYGAVSVGVINGYEDETFQPNGTLEHEYAPGLVANAANPSGSPSSFDPTAEMGPRPLLEGASVSGAPNGKSLEPTAHSTRDAADGQQERLDSTNAIVDELDASNSHRYQAQNRDSGFVTFCNVFAHDYAFLMGAFVPRVWWSYSRAEIEGFEASGQWPEPTTANTREMRASAIEDWFADWGHRFGWSRLGTTDPDGLTAAQDHANDGRVVIMVGDTDTSAPGHITAVIPETTAVPAKRDDDGRVIRPAQSESGAVPTTRGTSGWFDSAGAYPGGLSVWVHA